MDKNRSLYTEIKAKLNQIDTHIDQNQWGELDPLFAEIRTLEHRVDKTTAGPDLAEIKQQVLDRINEIETKINAWKESQKGKITANKQQGSHMNGYMKQPQRSYYIDKSE